MTKIKYFIIDKYPIILPTSVLLQKRKKKCRNILLVLISYCYNDSSKKISKNIRYTY